MKKLEAIIKPYKLDEVKEALAALGVDGITIAEVKGYEHTRSKPVARGRILRRADPIPRIKLEVVVRDSMLQRTTEVLVMAAKTGHRGDGKLFVSPVDSVVRIRTGERDASAV